MGLLTIPLENKKDRNGKIDYMDIDNLKIWQIEQDNKLRDEINNTYVQAQSENIRQIRNLIIQFIIISSAIIGFTIPVFGRSDLIKSNLLLTGGLSELLIVILYGFGYLQWIIQKENKELSKQHDRFNSYLDIPREARNKFLSEINEVNFKNWQKKQKQILDDIEKKQKKKIIPDNTLIIIFIAFFLGLFLITLSMLINVK